MKMEKEISNGAMLGIVLIALAAIIGLGFGVFAIAKGTANDGVTNVQESLGAVGASAFTDYDQKIVTGTQVISAYQSFEGKPYSVIIATQATKDKSQASPTSTSHVFREGAGVKEAFGTSGTNLGKLAVVYAYEEGSTATTQTPFKTKDSNGVEVELKLLNYNAILGNNDRVTKGAEGYASRIEFDSTCWRATDGFATEGGKVLMNNITGNLAKSGMMEYIPSGARFQAYLIKDLSGTIMGVAFEQINTR